MRTATAQATAEEPRKRRWSSVHDIGLEYLAAAELDVDLAYKRLLSDARHDPALLALITAHELPHIVNDIIRGAVRDNRQRVWNASPAAGGAADRARSQAARVDALAESNVENLENFPLPGGKLLRDASGPEIVVAAQFYSRQSRDMAHKARWLALVAGAVPAGKTAGDLGDGKLRELKAKAGAE